MLERRNTPRTHYIHRISYTTQERIVGSFVLLALGILLWLLFASGKTQNLFEENLTLYGRLATAEAVSKDTAVLIAGITAGTVSDVGINTDNSILVTMKILKKYQHLLRSDSVAKLSNFNFAVIGKAAIEISAGSVAQPILDDGSTIQISSALNLKDVMDRLTPVFANLEASIERTNQILAAIEPERIRNSIGKADEVLSTIDSRKLHDTLDNLYQITTMTRDITAHVSAGKGVAGTLLYDEKFDASVKIMTTTLDQATGRINELLATIQEQLKSTPELLEKIDPLLSEVEATVKASQRIWPLSTAIGERAPPATLTPTELGNE